MYSVQLFVIHAGLAVVAFFVVNWVGKHAISAGYYRISFIAESDGAPAFNTLFRVLAPLVFLVLTAAIWYGLRMDGVVHDYYMVTVYYFAARWLFNIAMGRRLLLLWGKQIFIATVTIALSYVLYSKILRFRHNVLPDPTNLANELWIIAILFIYETLNRVTWPYGASVASRRKRYIRQRYRAVRQRFGRIVTSNATSRVVEAAAYAVLIYEEFNRPPIFQFIERRILFPLGLARSLGPMQVRVSRAEPDDELVALGVRKVATDWASVETELKEKFPEVLASQGASAAPGAARLIDPHAATRTFSAEELRAARLPALMWGLVT